MTMNILNDVWLIKDKPLSEIRTYLMSFQMDCFEEYFENSPHNDEQKKWALLFALLAFDQKSPYIIPKQDALVEKQKICEALNIPEFFVPDLVELKDSIYRRCVTEFLFRFAGEMFRDLCFKKIQLIRFEVQITNRDFGKVTGKDDSVRYEYGNKEHHEAIRMKNMLARDIEKLENELLNRTRLVGIEQINALIDRKSKSAFTGGPMRGFPENVVVGK